MKRPKCPNDWMSWFDKLVNRFSWWIRFSPLTWEEHTRRWINERCGKANMRLYLWCSRLSKWSLHRGKIRAEKKWEQCCKAILAKFDSH